MSCPHGFIEKLAALGQSGLPFVSVTMVDAVGSVPQEVGSKMLVDRSGLAFGTVGGGRVEQHAIAKAKELLNSSPTSAVPVLVQWNLKRDIGMTCGGTVSLFFEAFNHRIWPIAIFGAGHVAAALVNCLLTLDCQITVVDSRIEWLDKMPESERLKKCCTDDLVSKVADVADDSFVLLMTMGHRTDRPVLEALLKSQIEYPYLGVIGSRGKRGALRKELIANGVSADRADAFRCPIGLPLGSNEPGEIAISVAAELIQVRDERRTIAQNSA